MRKAVSMIFMLYGVGLAAACEGSDVNSQDRVVPISNTTAVSAPASVVAARQRQLLAALTRLETPLPMVDARFVILDCTKPADFGEQLGGTGDFIAGRRVLPREYANTATMDVRLDTARDAIVTARFAQLPPTVTYWELLGDEWKARWLLMNVREAAISRITPSSIVCS